MVAILLVASVAGYMAALGVFFSGFGVVGAIEAYYSTALAVLVVAVATSLMCPRRKNI